MKKRKVSFISVLLLFLFCFRLTVHAEVTPPGTVELVSAVSEFGDQVTINWKKVPDAVGYRVYVRSGQNWKKMVTTSNTSFTHKTSAEFPIHLGQVYTYTVKAYKLNGTEKVWGGFDKNGISVKIAKPKLGIPNINSVEETAYNKLKISWSEVPGAQGYRVYVQENGKWVRLGTTKNTYFTHVDKTKHPLEIGKKYTYAVRAYHVINSKFYWGDYSKGASGKTHPQEPAMVNVSLEAGTKVTVRWKKAAGAEKYQIFRKEAGKDWKLLTTVENPGAVGYTQVATKKFPIEMGKTYYYTVRAVRMVNGKALYSTKSNGLSILIQKISAVSEAETQAKAREIIARVTNDRMTQYQKLRACWNWIMESDFHVWMFPDTTMLNWKYQCAYDLFEKHDGNCYGYACGFAAMAKELGYEPYVIEIPEIHCFVYVNGGYWDNMGNKQGVPNRPLRYTEDQIFKY